eukprot:Phypoly_transcript_11811.p1 GENE.Phypoly_transcript_11811~~Phypoly_transcript_11811.p1  ORF type:complete len:127 (+),score=8.94 Phypoly_transcript_11811:289-669(+)
MDVYKHHFAPPNARTCYSLQGLTIGPKINIFDTACPYVDKHWLITTLSRATTLDIKSYKTQDINRFGDISAYDKQYITPAWIVDHLGNARFVHCGVDIADTWEVDRIDNLFPHTTTNCTLSCMHCN